MSTNKEAEEKTTGGDAHQKVTLRARYTGRGEICYRWVGHLGGGTVEQAQTHPLAEVVWPDTWSTSDVDPRISRKTVVRVPMGMFVVESTRQGIDGEPVYTAGILLAEQGGKVDYSRTRHVRVLPAEPLYDLPRRHEVEVDGDRHIYAEADPRPGSVR